MGGHSHYSEGYGPVGPAPSEHSVVYTTLHFDKPWSYENYLKTGGYSALRKILEEKIEPAAVVEMVKASGLRGRGGAGFPTGIKLRTVAAATGTPVVLANGSEGEPVSWKDKALMSAMPHLVLDGALHAAAAVAADEVVIAIERAATTAWRAMNWAIAERQGREAMVAVRLVPVPAHYVAGEETALVQLVNGGPAKPTATPPRPFERGVAGRPTLVDNVETLAHLATVAQHGPNWFRQVGTADEPGSVLVTVSGAVARRGVYEVALGTPFTEIVRMAGGAPNGVAALLVGGYYGAWISAEDAAASTLSNASLTKVGAAVGCGAIVVLPTGACGVTETARLMRWFAGGTAGQCGPCVHGLPALAGVVESFAAGRPARDADALLDRWSGQVDGRGGCRFPDGAVRLLRSARFVFADDFDRHRSGRACRAGTPLLPIPEPTEEPWR